MQLFVCLFSRPVNKNSSDKDAGPSPRLKREADSDGGEEMVFTKKSRNDAGSANELK